MEKIEKLTLVFLIIVVISFILNVFVNVQVYGYLLGLVQVGFSIAGLVFSIILIKRKRFVFGLTFLTFFLVVLLYYIASILLALAFYNKI